MSVYVCVCVCVCVCIYIYIYLYTGCYAYGRLYKGRGSSENVITNCGVFLFCELFCVVIKLKDVTHCRAICLAMYCVVCACCVYVGCNAYARLYRGGGYLEDVD